MMLHQVFLILLLGLGLATAELTGETEIDVDENHDWDIDNINAVVGLNLLEGDIEQNEIFYRNSILGHEYRWPTTVPYYLDDSLDMNAKGVILKAFDQYRLKTCIDFKPWKEEKNYISVFKGDGCYSSVGNQHVGKQRLSIGRNCDRLGTVMHEFLHALGFWHEQSRADRDDYVNIMWDHIEPGKEHNFKIRDDTVSSDLGVPYDYDSLMHYSKTSFSIGSEPTIVPKIPQFTNVIGQRMGFSASDLTKLNRLYNCTESSTFVESCDFEEENICGMVQKLRIAKWERRTSVSGGPQTDVTNMGQCQGEGHFMHFSTAPAAPGDEAVLETRWLYPKHGAQCLQFFLYNTAGATDVLSIYRREFAEGDDSIKNMLLKNIQGGGTGSWELHTVNMNVTKKTSVGFHAQRRGTDSEGGFSLDDINLSSTKCPQHIWHIRNITGLLATTPSGQKLYSPRFVSPAGYSFQIGVYLNGKSNRKGYMAVYFHLTSGPNDDKLKWPCPWQQATMALMDQQSDIREQMNMHRMVTTDPNKMSSDGTEFFWDDPRKVGSNVTESNGGSYHRGPGTGTSSFITHDRLGSRKFIKGDDAYFLLSLEDISHLLVTRPRVAANADVGMKAADQDQDQDPPRRTSGDLAVITALAVSVAAAMLFVVSLLVLGDARRTRARRKDTVDVVYQPGVGGGSERPTTDLPCPLTTP
ncbi:meprin A subunit beta-like [Solea senegalensis]|uniref:Meprin A subunit beta-like n=1 Tax=Solea senegalensis TaxID=28829 RepID=A0AAV6S6F3_SOLSE|nr:meprin A subunit beta-like [Solea senegalensis]KAG7513543.1 meprin A subunit beta-like [Solea senegalensis]